MSLFTNAIEPTYERASSQQKANELYRQWVPLLKDALERGRPVDDPYVEGLIGAIINLVPAGTKRSSFERRYMLDKSAMLRLPQDPNALTCGYWWV